MHLVESNVLSTRWEITSMGLLPLAGSGHWWSPTWWYVEIEHVLDEYGGPAHIEHCPICGTSFFFVVCYDCPHCKQVEKVYGREEL